MDLVQAVDSFAIGTDFVNAGEIFDAEHPIVKGTPADYWREVSYRGVDVEEATAKPGAKRRTTKPKAE